MDKIKIAVIGAGVWGKTHAYLYGKRREVEITGVCDKSLKRAEEMAEQLNINKESVFDDYIKMLDNIDCDAVAIVTPDHLHRELAVGCAERGKHILLEKPLATSLEDINAIAKAVKENNVRIMVDLHNRWSPPFAAVKDAIEKGEIGEPYSAYFRLNDIKWVATDMLPWASKSSILWFLGSHSLDTLRWMFNDEVDEVYAVSRKGILAAEGIDTEDIFQSIIKFKNGGIATMENSWITPNSHPCINDIKFNITGTNGMFSLDLSNNNMIERFTENKNDRPDVLVKHFIHGEPKGFSYESINSFVDKLLSGEEFIVTLKDSMHTCLALLAIIESAKTGLPIKLDYSALTI